MMDPRLDVAAICIVGGVLTLVQDGPTLLWITRFVIGGLLYVSGK